MSLPHSGIKKSQFLNNNEPLDSIDASNENDILNKSQISYVNSKNEIQSTHTGNRTNKKDSNMKNIIKLREIKENESSINTQKNTHHNHKDLTIDLEYYNFSLP